MMMMMRRRRRIIGKKKDDDYISFSHPILQHDALWQLPLKICISEVH
jgi:hypothetical protein